MSLMVFSASFCSCTGPVSSFKSSEWDFSCISGASSFSASGSFLSSVTSDCKDDSSASLLWAFAFSPSKSVTISSITGSFSVSSSSSSSETSSSIFSSSTGCSAISASSINSSMVLLFKSFSSDFNIISSISPFILGKIFVSPKLPEAVLSKILVFESSSSVSLFCAILDCSFFSSARISFTLSATAA